MGGLGHVRIRRLIITQVYALARARRFRFYGGLGAGRYNPLEINGADIEFGRQAGGAGKYSVPEQRTE